MQNNFKQYEDSLHLYNKSKVHIKKTTAIVNNEGYTKFINFKF